MLFRRHSGRATILILCFMAALGSLTVDLYLPALPRIQEGLDASTAATQLSLTATTVGLAVGQLVVGNWSDAVGRRLPLLISTAINILASGGIVLTDSISVFLTLRLFQGLGAAGSAVSSMAIVRDLFAGARFVQALARIAIVTGMMPVIAPFLGVQLLQLMDWRSIFWIVAVYGLAMLVLALLGVKESLPVARRLSMQPRAVLARYATLARSRTFAGSAMVSGLMVSGVFTMMTASSFLLQETYGLDGLTYSVVFACNAIAFVIGTQTAARIIRRISPFTVLRVTLPTVATAGFGIIPGATYGVIGVTVATVIFMTGAGAIGPCTSVIALGDQGHQAGTAAALLGAANFGMAGLTAPLVGLFGVSSVLPMACLMGASVAAAALVYWTVIDRARPPSGSQLEDLVTSTQ